MNNDPEIQFFIETEFTLSSEQELQHWLIDVLLSEAKELGYLNFILLSDDALLEMNKNYLDHEYYTDVITFDLSNSDIISGEIYISIDRVIDNANELNKEVDDELHRVMVHGLLHLVGYDDKSPEDKELMTSKEDKYLHLRPF